MRPHRFVLTIMTAAATAAFPISARAQQPTTAPFQPFQRPDNYLDQAGTVLNAVPRNVAHDAKRPLDDLRKHFDALNKAYREQKDQVGPPLTRDDAAKDTRTWRDNFSDVERDLVVLIGGGSSLAPSAVPGSEPVAPNPSATEPGVPASTIAGSSPSPVGTTGTMPSIPPTTAPTPPSVGTPTTTNVIPTEPPNPNIPTTAPASGTSSGAPPAPLAAPSVASGVAPTPSPTAPGSASAATSGDTLTMANSLAASKVSVTGERDLDPAVRSDLEQFRLQLELFYSATMGNLR